MLLGSLATLSSLIICASSGFLWLREAAVAWRTEPTNRYQDSWVWDGALLLLSCPFFTSVTFNVSFITQIWKYLSHRVRAFFMTLFVSNDRKPNPNWLLTKGHLLVYVGEKSRGRDGFRHRWIQSTSDIIRTLSSVFYCRLQAQVQRVTRWLAAVPDPESVCFNSSRQAWELLQKSQLNSRCSNCGSCSLPWGGSYGQENWLLGSAGAQETCPTSDAGV